MDRTEEFIKTYLTKKAGMDRGNKTVHCLSEEILLEYIGKKLDADECKFIESHLAQCGFCLSQLSLAFEAQKMNEKKDFPAPPQGFIEKAEELLKPDKNTVDTRMTAKRGFKKNLFLTATIICFILSFLIPRYFMQFLAAALILGLRWVFESESAHTFIMVIDSWRRHSRHDDEEISRRLKNKV